jgi:hypothetical protein
VSMERVGIEMLGNFGGWRIRILGWQQRTRHNWLEYVMHDDSILCISN